VKRGMDTSEVLTRFRYERQILANLDHPYIASLHDGGTTADGRPFFVMEFVEGEPVHLFCQRHNLDTKTRCRLFLRICEAVAHAHRNLVVHRDLKPANILITAGGAPKLLDFGLAKLLDADADRGQTAAMVRVFTPDYASPEQIRGATVTTATDVYSLGAIFYEMLTGRRAHRLTGLPLAEMQRVVCEEEIERPGSIVPGLDPDLDNIILMAMRKEPERRYPSVEQFAEDVQRHLDSHPVRARKDSWGYRFRKFASRKRYALAAGAAIAASLVAGSMIALSQARQAKAARDGAVLERHRAEERLSQIASLSDRLLSDVYGSLERLPGATEARRELVGSTLALLAQLSKQAENDPRLRFALAKAYLRLGDLQGDPDVSNIGDFPEALKSYRVANALVGTVPPPGSAERLQVWADIQDKTSKVVAEMGDRNAAREMLRNAIAVVEQNPGVAGQQLQPMRATLYLSLSRTTLDLPQALGFAERALDAAQSAARQFPGDISIQLTLSGTYTQFGFVHILLGDPEAAEKPYQESARIRERLYQEHPNDQIFRRFLKLAYEHYAGLEGNPDRVSLGHPEIARAYYKKARPLEEADLADPENSLAKFDYALFLIEASRVEAPPSELPESLANLRKAAATFESLAAAEPGVVRYRHSIGNVHQYMGDLLRKMKKPRDASEEYQQALRIFDHLPAPSITPTVVRDTLDSQRTAVLALIEAGDRDGALLQANQFSIRAEKSPPTIRASKIAEADLTLAKVYKAFGECDAAAAAASRSLRRARPLMKTVPGDPLWQIVREAESLLDGCRNPSRP